ncbi:hypothetical protein WAI453_001919 [Rhynchosporium graminicola]
MESLEWDVQQNFVMPPPGSWQFSPPPTWAKITSPSATPSPIATLLLLSLDISSLFGSLAAAGLVFCEATAQLKSGNSIVMWRFHPQNWTWARIFVVKSKDEALKYK